jgi:hypothetical protein
LLAGAAMAQPLVKSGPCPAFTRSPLKMPFGFQNNTMQDPLTPAQSVNCIETAPGFQAELWASEMDPGGITAVMAFTFDDRGRMWAVESKDYPNTLTEPFAGHDRVIILEDTDHDRRMDKATVFAEGFNIAQAIEWTPAGLVLAMPPYLLLLEEYWNRAGFVCEPTVHLIAQFFFEPKGSTWKATVDAARYNLFASTDAWTAPIMAKVGQDGALWVIDWYSYIIQHNGDPTGAGNAFLTDLRDKRYCRIYRIVPTGKPLEPVLDLRGASILLWRMQAQRLLLAKAATGPAAGVRGRDSRRGRSLPVSLPRQGPVLAR